MNGKNGKIEQLDTTPDFLDYKIVEEFNIPLSALRCRNCNRFLEYVAIVEGAIAIKCKQCHSWNVYDAHTLEVDNDTSDQ